VDTHARTILLNNLKTFLLVETLDRNELRDLTHKFKYWTDTGDHIIRVLLHFEHTSHYEVYLQLNSTGSSTLNTTSSSWSFMSGWAQGVQLCKPLNFVLVCHTSGTKEHSDVSCVCVIFTWFARTSDVSYTCINSMCHVRTSCFSVTACWAWTLQS
jgi:hypothetical protein